MKKTLIPLCCVLATMLTFSALANDWPQWRGPNRDGISTETGLLAAWPEGGPKVLWQENVGQGYSSVAVVGDRLYTMGNTEGFVKTSDLVSCLDAKTGKLIWKYTYASKPGSYPGPRATPTVDAGFVYTLGRHGDLVCLAAEDGTLRWEKDVRKEFDIGDEPRTWGLCCSPLIVGDSLILDLGKVLVMNKNTGELVCSLGDDAPAFSSSMAFTVGGKQYVTSFNQHGLVCYDLAARKEAGRHAWQSKWLANSATPVIDGNRIFITSGYDRGCALLALTPKGLEPAYENTHVSSECSTGILLNGHIYAVTGVQGRRGSLKCLDFSTGEVKWESGEFRVGGGLMLADGKFFQLQGKGELVMAEATPEAYRELGRAEVLTGYCWTMPVLSDGRLYCRNSNGDLVCLDVRGN